MTIIPHTLRYLSMRSWLLYEGSTSLVSFGPSIRITMYIYYCIFPVEGTNPFHGQCTLTRGSPFQFVREPGRREVLTVSEQYTRRLKPILLHPGNHWRVEIATLPRGTNRWKLLFLGIRCSSLLASWVSPP